MWNFTIRDRKILDNQVTLEPLPEVNENYIFQLRKESSSNEGRLESLHKAFERGREAGIV